MPAQALSRGAPAHLGTRRGTQARCFELGTSPGGSRWAQGQEQAEPSYFSEGGSERETHTLPTHPHPPHTLARFSLLRALPLAAFPFA